MHFDFGDFIKRWVIAVVLVIATYNPTEWSFVTWVLQDLSPNDR